MSNSIPYFSVVIPTYNREKFIKTAIDSVLNQSFEDFELLIVDDGSKDNTRSIVEGINDSRVKYIYQENAERSAARNNGIDKALGKYICFLDSDDIYYTDHLETFHEEISRLNEPIAMFYNKEIPNLIKNESYNRLEQVLKYIIYPQEVCIHRDILATEKFDVKLRVVEDIDLWMRVVYNHDLININKTTIEIIEHDGRSVNYIQTNSLALNLSLFKNLYSMDKFASKVSKQVQDETIGDCYFGVGKYYGYKGEKLKGAYYLLKSYFINGNRMPKYKLNLAFSLFFRYSKFKTQVEQDVQVD